MSAIRFQITAVAADCAARLARVDTPHGSFDTPAFMPVGTQAAVKGVLPDALAAAGAQIVLANTFHLMLRPGSALVAAIGGADGLHSWMRWPRPILTDSGGFQVFSLADISRITDEGVQFRSPHDGQWVDLTPQRSMQVQNELGADIIMAFDDCPPAKFAGAAGDEFDEADAGMASSAGAPPQPAAPPAAAPRHAIDERQYARRVAEACQRSVRWLETCIHAHQRRHDQALFGIVQGGTDLDRRTWCAQRVCGHDLPGYAIGGVAVGEGFEQLKRVVEHTAPLLPAERPRYLMGVGYERDILAAVRAGVDMFDCVLPTRNARNANAFTSAGQMRLKNTRYTDDPRPIEEACDCHCCAGGFSRSYLRHLFMAGEMLGPILVSLHNLRHFQRFMLDIRRAIREDDWSWLDRRWPVAANRLKYDKE